jgi:hypothetical protein
MVVMQWVAEVAAATGRTVAYAGGLAEISANPYDCYFCRHSNAAACSSGRFTRRWPSEQAPSRLFR